MRSHRWIPRRSRFVNNNAGNVPIERNSLKMTKVLKCRCTREPLTFVAKIFHKMQSKYYNRPYLIGLV